MGWICARVLCSLVIESKANFCFVWITDIILILFFFSFSFCDEGMKKKKRCSRTGPFPISHQVTKSKGTTTIFAARTLAVILLFYSRFFPLFTMFLVYSNWTYRVCVYIYIYILCSAVFSSFPLLASFKSACAYVISTDLHISLLSCSITAIRTYIVLP